MNYFVKMIFNVYVNPYIQIYVIKTNNSSAKFTPLTKQETKKYYN